MSVYHHIRGGTEIFFQQGLIFLESDKNWLSFVFTVLPKHIKIKSQLKCISQFVAEWLSLQVSILPHHHITASLEVRASTVLDSPIIFCMILNKSNVSQLFIADLLHFIMSYYTSSSSH